MKKGALCVLVLLTTTIILAGCSNEKENVQNNNEVIGEVAGTDKNEATSNNETDVVNATGSVTENDEFFENAKLEREQARGKEKDYLIELTEDDTLDSAKRNEAANEMLKIQETIEKETAAEALIEAKGYQNAYVRIDIDTVDVIIDKAELTVEELAQIEDIVKRKTGYDASQIRITTFKTSK